MKKLIVVLLTVCLLLPCLAVLTACQPDDINDDINFDKMVIKNWSQYSAIGVGSANSQAVASNKTLQPIILASVGGAMRNVAYAETTATSTKLIGQLANGDVEQISFVDSDNNTHDQKWYVQSFKRTRHITFVQFVNTPTQLDEYYSYEPSGRAYVINNETGKMYFIPETRGWDIFGIRDYMISDIATYVECHGNYDNRWLNRLSFQDDNLVVEKCLDLIKDWPWVLVDKYDNVYLGNSIGEINYIRSSYIYKNGTLQPFEKTLYKSMNGRAYVYEYDEDDLLPPNTFVNENKELETSDFVTPIGVWAPENLLKQVGNVSYYFAHIWSSYPSRGIAKMEKIDDLRFTIEYIEFWEESEDTNYKGKVFANDKLYFLTAKEVFSVDIFTGKRETLVANYVFNKIYSDNLGNILFEGLNMNLANVVGIINADGTITENITPQKFEVYVIAPIN